MEGGSVVVRFFFVWPFYGSLLTGHGPTDDDRSHLSGLFMDRFSSQCNGKITDGTHLLIVMAMKIVEFMF